MSVRVSFCVSACEKCAIIKNDDDDDDDDDDDELYIQNQLTVGLLLTRWKLTKLRLQIEVFNHKIIVKNIILVRHSHLLVYSLRR